MPQSLCGQAAQRRNRGKCQPNPKGSADFGPWRCCATGPVARATEPAPRLARLPKSDTSANVGIAQCFLWSNDASRKLPLPLPGCEWCCIVRIPAPGVLRDRDDYHHADWHKVPGEEKVFLRPFRSEATRGRKKACPHTARGSLLFPTASSAARPRTRDGTAQRWPRSWRFRLLDSGSSPSQMPK